MASNIQTVTVGPLAAAAANNIVTSTTPVSGTALTLNGALVTNGVAIMDKPRQVLLTFGVEGSNRTLVVTGTNSNGNPIQETLAVASGAGGAVATTQSFATVTKLLPLGGGWTAAATVGTNALASSQWIIVDPLFGPMNFTFTGTISGTVNYQIDITLIDVNNNAYVIGSQSAGNFPIPPVPLNPTGFSGLSANAFLVLNQPFSAWRATLVSGSGTLSVTGQQAGIFNG